MTNSHLGHLMRSDCPVPQGTPAFIYCRDSGGQGQDRSITQQVQVSIEYCAQFGLEVKHIYMDEAKRSTNTDKRPQFKQMIADLQALRPVIDDRNRRRDKVLKNPFSVVVWDINRISRDPDTRDNITSDLRLRAITIVDLSGFQTTGNVGADRIVTAVKTTQDEALLDDISKEAKRALALLVSLQDTDPKFLSCNPDWLSTGRYLGMRPGTPPAGFRGIRLRIGYNERKQEYRYAQRIVPDKESGIWDRCFLAWKMRHEQAKLEDIHNATQLYDSLGGYVTFFSNRIYTGDCEFGDLILENFVEALIPHEWYDEEQARRQARAAKLEQNSIGRNEPRRVVSQHLLSGLLYCCADAPELHLMSGNARPAKPGEQSEWRSYRCSRKKKSHGGACHAPSVSETTLHQAVIERLMIDVFTLANLHKVMPHLNREFQQKDKLKTQMKLVKTQLRAVDNAIDKIMDSVEQGLASPAANERLAKREQEREELRAEMTRLQSQQSHFSAFTNDNTEKLRSTIQERLLNGDVQVARHIVQTLIARIEVKDRHAKLYYNFPTIHE